MRGLELLDAAAVAVLIDENGEVKKRFTATNADLGKAAASALEKVAGSNGPLGVAVFNPDAAAVSAALKSLDRRADGKKREIVSSGIAAAVAEAWTGAGRGINDIVYFGVGEHAVAGVLRDGVPVTGAHGRAASSAWLALNPVEREDYRKTGCLEAEVAASGIVRRLIWRIKAGDRSRVQELAGGDLAAVSLAHVLSGARAGDGVAVSVIRDTAKYLGMAAANLVAIADPEMLVLGGIMASDADLLLEPVRSEIARRLPPPMMQTLMIATAKTGADAPAIGAARLAASKR